MKKFTLILSAAMALASCSPKITSSLTSSYQALPADSEVVILDEDAPNPENAEMLGQINIGDTGFTTKSGTYDAVLEIAKTQARKAGGNIVRIVEHRRPDSYSSIHRIKAYILRVEDLSALSFQQEVMSSHPDYAVIYFWRDSGSIVTYDVHIGDTKVYRSRPDTKAEVKVYDEGEIVIWAKTEAKDELPVTVKKGRDYYIWTGVTAGYFVGHPLFVRVAEETGRTEYESIQ